MVNGVKRQKHIKNKVCINCREDWQGQSNDFVASVLVNAFKHAGFIENMEEMLNIILIIQ